MFNTQDNTEQRYTSTQHYGYFDVNKFLDQHPEDWENISYSETEGELSLCSTVEH